MLKSDSQGFLIGEPVDIGRAVDQLRTIRNDVSAIKNALLDAPNSGSNDSKNTAIDQAAKVITPPSPRNLDNKPVGRSATPTRTNSGTKTPGTALTAPKATVAVVRTSSINNETSSIATPGIKGTTSSIATPKGRDASGRFVGKTESDAKRDKTTGRFTSNGGDDDERRSNGILNNFVDRIATTAMGVTAGAEEADPAIKAFREVAEPMTRGYQTLFGGGGNKEDRWYKKIFKELNLFRKDETAFNKAQNKVLKNIEGKPSGGDGDSSVFIGGLLGRIAPMVMMAVAGVGGALLAGVGAVLGIIFSPIGLAIGAAATVAWGLFTENGQKFFGEVGAKILAGWDGVVTAFAPVTESISKGWNTVKDGFDSLISGMASTWDAFTGFLKDKFGIDIPAIFKPVVDVSKKAVEAAKETVNAGTDKAVEAVKKSSPKTTEALGNVWDKAKEGVSKITSHATGKTAENKNALINQMADSGITDPKEQAMFMAEMDHESGGFTKMEESFNYRSADRLMGISKSARSLGKPAIEAAMAQGPEAVAEAMYGGRMGNVNKGDAYAFRGRGLTQLTGRDNYAAAGKDLGLDLVNNPDLAAHPENAAKIAAWYWKKNNLGDSAKKGDVKTNRHGVNGGEIGLADVEQKFDKYLVAANNGEFNANATDKKISGVTELASDEQANAYRKQQGKPYLDKVAAINANNMPLYHSLAAGPVNSSQTQNAFAAAPKVPTFTPTPAPAEAPPQVTPLASFNSDRNVTVTMPNADVGRDISDRGIAHIVTGGLSGHG
jgi:putative chitinase